MFGLFGKKASAGPDFSATDSVEKVLALAAEGVLEPLLLLPEAFGGDDAPTNVVHVPVGIAALKARTDENVIMPLAMEGRFSRYSATPRYAGRSHVPIAIDILASDPGRFEFTVKIWGEGLRER